MIRGIEVFSGAGGLAKGLSMAGVEHLAFVEWDSDACKTLRRNFGNEIVHERDIRTFDFHTLSDIDFIAGGPPCQPFSVGGKAKGNEDSRDMFPSAIRSIRELSPKAFMFENVKGLLRASFKEYLDYILIQLQYPEIEMKDETWADHFQRLKDYSNLSPKESLQYNVAITLVNAADFGVPQKRERIIIVGTRKDLNLNWTFPNPTHCEDSLLWDKWVTEEYWKRHCVEPSEPEKQKGKKIKKKLLEKYGMFPPELKSWVTIRDILANTPQMSEPHFYQSEHIIRNGAKEYPGHTGSPIDEPSKTIKAGGHGVPGGENMIKFNNGETRYYTVFEAKRIQTFPDDYEITGSWTEAMRQIGNAVPVKLAKVIGSSIISAMTQSQ